MKVFKFGGASVKDVSGVRNVAIILQSFVQFPVVVVISAMGKTTNALEKILNLFRDHSDHHIELSALKHFHASIMEGLFPKGHAVFSMVDVLFNDLESALTREGKYDVVYDQVVSYGELLSTVMVHQYLLHKKLPSTWAETIYLRTTPSGKVRSIGLKPAQP
jgi:aspartate kinase